MKCNRLELLRLYHIFHALFLKVFEKFAIKTAVKPRTSAVSACGPHSTSVISEKCRDFAQMCESRSATRLGWTDEHAGMIIAIMAKIICSYAAFF